MTTRCNFALAAALLWGGLTLTTAAGAVNYGAIELGAVGSYTIPSAINNSGQVVGSLNDWSGGFITGPDGVGKTDLVPVVDPNAIGFNFVLPTAISETGEVVGYAFTAEIPGLAFMTGPNGLGMTSLGSLGTASIANGINANGQVVGDTSFDIYKRAFITDPGNNNAMIALGTLGGSGSSANGINLSGQVVGFAETLAGERHAFVTDPANNNAMIDLGTLGGPNSNAYAINDDGVVVGDSNINAAGYNHAFVFDTNGGSMIDLGNLMSRGPTYNSSALAINASGQVVGWSDFRIPGATVKHAFLMNAGELNMTSLNDLNSLIDLASLGGDFLSVAYGINDAGQIITSSWFGGAYLLTPIAAAVAVAAAPTGAARVASAPVTVTASARYALTMLAAPVAGTPLPGQSGECHRKNSKNKHHHPCLTKHDKEHSHERRGSHDD